VQACDLIKRADEVLALGRVALGTRYSTNMGFLVKPEPFAAFRASGLSFLSNLFGATHPYFTDFDSSVSSKRRSPADVEAGIGIVSAARDELEGGWLQTARGLLSAEIFADFLEMAEHLLAEKYKDAAAVIAGSSLEEHLRQLATAATLPTTRTKDDVEVPLKADALNADLAKAGVYSRLEQKSVTMWLDLRNKAAHGRYDEYDHTQVSLMVEGVRQFISRVPV
jgi:hypothetical protein